MWKSAGFTLVSKLLVAVLNFAVIILISRFLGPAERGICSWYLVVIAVSLIFSETIAGPTAGFLLLRFPERQVRYMSYVWAAIVALSVATFFFLMGKINQQEWILLCALCWLNAANTIHLHIFLALQRFRLFNGFAIIMPVLLVICLIVFFATGHLSRYYYLGSLGISWLVAFGAALLFLRKRSAKKEEAAWTALIKAGFRHGMANQASHLAGLLNNKLVFLILPASMLGIYSNSLALAEATTMIPGSLGQVMYAKLLQEKDAARSRAVAVFNWWLILILLSIVALIILFIPDDLYQFLFGEEFAGVKNHLVYLGVAFLFYGGYLVFSYWQSSQGHFIQNFYATLSGLLVNAGLSAGLYFSGRYTIETGIWALVAGFFTFFVVSIIQFTAKSGLPSLSPSFRKKGAV